MKETVFDSKPRTRRRVRALCITVAVACCAFCARVACASESADAKLDPLEWRGDLAIWTAVVFLLLVLLLAKFAFGPIVRALDERERREFEREAAADKANADAKALLEQYRQKLDESEEEVRRIIANAKADASAQASQVVEDAKRAAADERERAGRDIQAATEVAMREIAVKGARLATDLAGKIIQERIELDPSKSAQLVDAALNEMTE